MFRLSAFASQTEIGSVLSNATLDDCIKKKEEKERGKVEEKEQVEEKEEDESEKLKSKSENVRPYKVLAPRLRAPQMVATPMLVREEEEDEEEEKEEEEETPIELGLLLARGQETRKQWDNYREEQDKMVAQSAGGGTDGVDFEFDTACLYDYNCGLEEVQQSKSSTTSSLYSPSTVPLPLSSSANASEARVVNPQYGVCYAFPDPSLTKQGGGGPLSSHTCCCNNTNFIGHQNATSAAVNSATILSSTTSSTTATGSSNNNNNNNNNNNSTSAAAAAMSATTGKSCTRFIPPPEWRCANRSFVYGNSYLPTRFDAGLCCGCEGGICGQVSANGGNTARSILCGGGGGGPGCGGGGGGPVWSAGAETNNTSSGNSHGGNSSSSPVAVPCSECAIIRNQVVGIPPNRNARGAGSCNPLNRVCNGRPANIYPTVAGCTQNQNGPIDNYVGRKRMVRLLPPCCGCGGCSCRGDNGDHGCCFRGPCNFINPCCGCLGCQLTNPNQSNVMRYVRQLVSILAGALGINCGNPYDDSFGAFGGGCGGCGGCCNCCCCDGSSGQGGGIMNALLGFVGTLLFGKSHRYVKVLQKTCCGCYRGCRYCKRELGFGEKFFAFLGQLFGMSTAVVDECRRCCCRCSTYRP